MRTARRPNLVFVFPDQLRYRSLGYAGDTQAITPNIDRFATQAVNFSNAVASAPVCTAHAHLAHLFRPRALRMASGAGAASEIR
jgi:arylsulfatase A-like enzyme